MKAGLLLAAALATGCIDPPAAWSPGDGDLEIDASGPAWQLALDGCAAWQPETGLLCVRRTGASVSFRMGDTGDGSSGVTRYSLGPNGEWRYLVTISERFGDGSDRSYARRVAAHEIGHLLGIWGHVDDEDGPALMTSSASSDAPTAADIAALP